MKGFVYIVASLLSGIMCYNLLNKYLFNFMIIIYFKKQFFTFLFSIIISYIVYIYMFKNIKIIILLFNK
jgi:hypothetical protein